MDTFLVRTLLVPSTVVLLGRWNWWPSRMSRASAELPLAEGAAGAAGAPPAVPAVPRAASGSEAAEPAADGTGSRQPDPLP
jgi:hypothetical protein